MHRKKGNRGCNCDLHELVPQSNERRAPELRSTPDRGLLPGTTLDARPADTGGGRQLGE